MLSLGTDIDVRTDLPGYWIYRGGKRAETIKGISALWQDDYVAVATGDQDMDVAKVALDKFSSKQRDP